MSCGGGSDQETCTSPAFAGTTARLEEWSAGAGTTLNKCTGADGRGSAAAPFDGARRSTQKGRAQGGCHGARRPPPPPPQSNAQRSGGILSVGADGHERPFRCGHQRHRVAAGHRRGRHCTNGGVGGGCGRLLSVTNAVEAVRAVTVGHKCR